MSRHTSDPVVLQRPSFHLKSGPPEMLNTNEGEIQEHNSSQPVREAVSYYTKNPVRSGVRSKQLKQRRSSFVFDDEPRKVSNGSSLKLNKMNPFKSTKSSKSIPQSPYKDLTAVKIENEKEDVPLYNLSNNSDEMFELMPTLAMGYENSIDKQLANTKRELRITGEGYYINQQEVEIEEDEEEEVKEESEQLDIAHDSQPMEINVNQIEKTEPKQNKKSFKRLFKWKSEPKETSSSIIKAEIPSVSSQEDSIVDSFHGTTFTVVPEPAMNIFFEEDNIEEEPIKMGNPETSNENEFSVPLLTPLFQRIDQSEGLTSAQKTLLKGSILLWILYELRCLFGL